MSKIVFLEDSTNKILLKKLTEAGIEAVQITNWSSAVSQIAKTKPDIIMLDLVLKGKEGIDLLKEIKRSPQIKDVPVIVYTDVSEEAGYSLAMNNGAYDFIIKNHRTVEQIVQMIKLFIEETS